MLIILLTVLMQTATAQSQEQPEWYVCQKDADCATAKYICDIPKAVNKKYSKALAKHVRAMAAECASEPLDLKPERAACMNSHCQLIYTTVSK